MGEGVKPEISNLIYFNRLFLAISYCEILKFYKNHMKEQEV